MNQRQTDILKRITELKKVKVADLSEEFGVSEVTIRKDLNFLEKSGLISRAFGFARINESDDIQIRLAQNYTTKLKIARAAKELVEDGDYVLIESGSCCTLLAAELARDKDVTIITNSAFIADYIRKLGAAKIILLGGEYQAESQVMVGPLMRDNLERFNVDIAFVGTDGYDQGFFSGSDFDRSQAVRDFSKRAEKTVVLTDSSKFNQKSRFNHLSSDAVSTVITDNKLSRERGEELKEYGIDLVLVK